MKQVSKKQWLLTASLLAVLAGNYAFQSSSVQMGAFEMSSETPVSNEMESQNDIYTANKSESELQKHEDARDKEMSRILNVKKAEAAKTQATTTSSGAECSDCKTVAAPSVLIKLDDYNKLIARISDLEKQKNTDKPSENNSDKPSEKKSDKSSDEKPEKETAKEKRERIAAELKAEKEAKIQAKKDKEIEKQDERVSKFEDKMEIIKDKCEKDLECLTTEFTETLSKFEGKNAIPKGVVNKFFKSMIGTPLAKSLYTDGPNSQASLEALQIIMSDSSEEYRGIKNITMDAVRYQTMGPASKIKEGYKSADAYSKQNNPQAYFQQLNSTREDQQTLMSLSSAYTTVIEQSLRENGDNSSIGYYQRSYLPDMKKIMNSLNAPAAPTGSTTATTQTTDSTRNTRNGQTVQNTNQNLNPQQQITEPAKMTRSGQVNSNSQTSWTLSTSPSGFQQGQPTTSTRGGRGVR